MSKQDFKTHEKAIMDISEDEVVRPFMPVSITVQMGDNLKVWTEPDRELLIKAGLDVKLIDELTSRGGALSYIESKWVADMDMHTEATDKWKQISPEGYELQAEMLHHFRFAFYGHDNLLNVVDKIAENGGHADMIQDLVEYSALGRNNKELLKATGFNMAMLSRAEQLADELTQTLAYTTRDRSEASELKGKRDRAFVHLYSAIREINRVGQFVFWRNPDRRKGYTNNYSK